MNRGVRITPQGKGKDGRPETVVAHPELERVDAKVALIQALIPVALDAVGELLTTEVTRLVGRKHSRTEGTPGYVRWGRPPGSLSLADQKVPLTSPRVRDRLRNHEVSLAPSQQRQTPRAADAGLFRKVLLGQSCRDYAACAEAVPAAFGLSPASASRRCLRASAQPLRALQARRLDPVGLGGPAPRREDVRRGRHGHRARDHERAHQSEHCGAG